MKTPLLLAGLMAILLASPTSAQPPGSRSTSIRLDQQALGIRQIPRLDPDQNPTLPSITLIPTAMGKEVRSNAAKHSMRRDVLIGAGIGAILGGTGAGIYYANRKHALYELGLGFDVTLGAVGGAIVGALLGAYVHTQR
jgi:hypothetical protein